MNEAILVKNGVLAALAAVGSGIANALGGWDAAMKVLVVLMVADYLTGFLVAAIWKRSPKSSSGALESKAGFKGAVKKCAILLLVFIAVTLDDALGMGYARTAVIIFFVGNEGLSLLENFGLMGVPYPAFLKRALEAMKEQGDKGEDGNGKDGKET